AAPRPRRLLRRRRAAGQAVPAGPAGRRRRGRRARCGGDSVLRGPRVRRPVGHVHGRGAAAVPVRDGVPGRPVRRLPGDLRRRHGPAPRALAAGGAGVAGRGLRRPGRGRGPRPVRRGGDGDRAPAEGPHRRGDRWSDRLGGHRDVEADGQDRLGPAEAGRAGRRPARCRARRAAPAAGDPAGRRRAGDGGTAAPDRRDDGRRAGCAVAGGPGGPGRQGARGRAARPGPGGGRPRRRRRPGREVGVPRGDLRARPHRPRRPRPRDRLDGRAGGGAAADVGVLRPHGDAQAAPLRLHDADPLPDAAAGHRRQPHDRRHRPPAAHRGGHPGRAAAARRRRLRAVGLRPGRPVRRGPAAAWCGRAPAGRGQRRGRPRGARARRRTARRTPLVAGAGRPPRGARARLGVGAGAGPGHRPLRGAPYPAWSGADTGRRRPVAAGRRPARLEDHRRADRSRV
ncbi:MAG: DNA polymerase IV, partial [uncultured Blastococcus sp.]